MTDKPRFDRSDRSGGDRPSFRDRPSFGGGRSSFGEDRSDRSDRPSFRDRPSFGGGRSSFGGDRRDRGSDKPAAEAKKPFDLHEAINNVNNLVNTLAKLMQQHSLMKAQVEISGVKLCLEHNGGAISNTNTATACSSVSSTPMRTVTPAAETGNYIHATAVGIIYVAEKPDAVPFVQVGDRIEIGQTIFVLEVMKTMSFLKADKAGIVKKILVTNGKAVEHNEKLLELE